MPAPHLQVEDLVPLCLDEIFLQQHAHPGINIEFVTSLKKLPFTCDRRQMGQVLTNIIQNSIEAIEAKGVDSGHVEVSLKTEDRKILSILDDGIGPPEGRERLTEPYVTFREKGTGLGLAIVKKIIEDHGGEIFKSIR